MYDLAKSGGGKKNSRGDDRLFARWVAAYPVVSIEDGLGENDWAGFVEHTALLGGTTQIVGDDLYVTNTRFIARGIAEHSTNAVLIKLNQIGTVTETIESIEMCRRAGWRYVVSHRSGETEDTVHRRLRGRDGRRPDQDRLAVAQRADREIQPAAGDRARAGQGGGVRKPVPTGIG